MTYIRLTIGRLAFAVFTLLLLKADMLKSRIRRQTIAAMHTSSRLAAIEASIRALDNEDLLDLADIFARGEPTPLTKLTVQIMAERNIGL